MISASDRLGKLIKWLFILILLVLVAVAVTPLNLYYDYVKQYARPLNLDGISGSLVKGSAESMNYMTAPLGQADWLLYPKSYNALGGQLRLRDQNYDLKFDLKKMNDDQHHFNQVNGYIDWDLIKPFVHLRYGKLDGYAQLNLSGIEYSRSNGLTRMSGTVVLQDFKMTQPSSKDLGLVTLTFETLSSGMVVGNFSSDSTVLNVSGTLYLHPRRWQLNVDIIPKAGHFEVDALFNGVGEARRGGGRRLNLAGFY